MRVSRETYATCRRGTGAYGPSSPALLYEPSAHARPRLVHAHLWQMPLRPSRPVLAFRRESHTRPAAIVDNNVVTAMSTRNYFRRGIPFETTTRYVTTLCNGLSSLPQTPQNRRNPPVFCNIRPSTSSSSRVVDERSFSKHSG